MSEHKGYGCLTLDAPKRVLVATTPITVSCVVRSSVSELPQRLQQQIERARAAYEFETGREFGTYTLQSVSHSILPRGRNWLLVVTVLFHSEHLQEEP